MVFSVILVSNTNEILACCDRTSAENDGYPIADISCTSWTKTGSNYYEDVDDVITGNDGDTTRIESSVQDSFCEVKLNEMNLAYGVSRTVSIEVVAVVSGGSKAGEKITVGLYNGATLIQEATNLTVDRSSYTEINQAFSIDGSTEIDVNAIDVCKISTDSWGTCLDDLRIRVTITTIGAGETIKITRITADSWTPDYLAYKDNTAGTQDFAIYHSNQTLQQTGLIVCKVSNYYTNDGVDCIEQGLGGALQYGFEYRFESEMSTNFGTSGLTELAVRDGLGDFDVLGNITSTQFFQSGISDDPCISDGATYNLNINNTENSLTVSNTGLLECSISGDSTSTSWFILQIPSNAGGAINATDPSMYQTNKGGKGNEDYGLHDHSPEITIKIDNNFFGLMQ